MKYKPRKFKAHTVSVELAKAHPNKTWSIEWSFEAFEAFLNEVQMLKLTFVLALE